MTNVPHILAEGISPGAVFGFVLFVVIAVVNVIASIKKKQEEQERQQRTKPHGNRPLERPARHGDDLATILEEHHRREQSAGRSHDPRRGNPPPLPTGSQRRKQKKSAKQTPQLSRVAPATSAESAVRSTPASDTEDAPMELRSRSQGSEASRNLRLMLQPAGIREAFLLGEVLGKPKSLKDE